MSTNGQFVWSFEEDILNKFEELQEDGSFDDIAAEILNNTNLSTVFVDEVRGIMSDYNYDENKFNDDVLIAMRIIEERYELLKDRRLIMEYKHINDCWAAIRKAKTIEEVKDLFEKFPRWSGDWDIMVEDGHYVVYNTWFDEQCDDFDTDCETLDIEVL